MYLSEQKQYRGVLEYCEICIFYISMAQCTEKYESVKENMRNKYAMRQASSLRCPRSPD